MNVKLNRPLSLVLALILGAGLLSGCSGGSGSASSQGSSSSTSSSSAPSVQPMDLSGVTDPYLATAGISGDTVVARAGEYDITADDMLFWLNYGVELYLSQTGVSSDSPIDWALELDGQTLEDYLVNSALETSAFYRLILETARQEGLEPSREDLDYLDEDLASAAEQMGSEELLDYLLWYQLRTREQYVRSYRAGVLYPQLQELYYGEGSEGYPTDAEVRAYADGEGYYRVKHILLSNRGEDGSTPLEEAAVAEKKAQADDLLSRLRAAQDPVALFDELMHEYSEDPGLAGYPDGYDAYPGQMVSEFEAASLALKEGEISEVVESDYGYHIILRLPLDVEEFRTQLISEKMQQWVQDWIDTNPPQTNDAWAALDLASFREKALSLQAAVQQALPSQDGEGNSSQVG